MFGVTFRQRVFVAAVVVLGAASAVVALAGWERGALAGLAVLATAGLVFLIDVRRRTGDVYRQLRKMAERQDKGSVSKHLAVHERRLLAAVESARLDDLDSSEATRAALDTVLREVRALRTRASQPS